MESRNQPAFPSSCDSEDYRCLCGSLMAKITPLGVEIKCRKCKRIQLIPNSRSALKWRTHRPKRSAECSRHQQRAGFRVGGRLEEQTSREFKVKALPGPRDPNSGTSALACNRHTAGLFAGKGFAPPQHRIAARADRPVAAAPLAGGTAKAGPVAGDGRRRRSHLHARRRARNCDASSRRLRNPAPSRAHDDARAPMGARGTQARRLARGPVERIS